MVRERKFQIPFPCPCLIERQGVGTTLESKNQLYCASQRAQLTQRLETDPTGKSPLGLDVGLTLGGRSEKHPSGPCVPAKKPRKGLSCASAEVFLNKYQPGSSLIHSFTIRLQTCCWAFKAMSIPTARGSRGRDCATNNCLFTSLLFLQIPLMFRLLCLRNC